jgi:hypothetical protein
MRAGSIDEGANNLPAIVDAERVGAARIAPGTLMDVMTPPSLVKPWAPTPSR